MLRVILLAVVALLAGIAEAHSIKHVIVVMMENRAFDHLLGWRPGVNGLKPDMCNDVEVGNSSSGNICVTDQAPQVAPCDPDHSTPATTYKLFGTFDPASNATPQMDGFVAMERMRGNAATNYCRVMDAFSVDNVPVMNGMADEFALFDKFHASVPGPTWPNRLFHLAGTSGGLTETSNPWFRNELGKLFPMRTIFDQVQDAGMTWKVYVNDTPWELFLETLAHNPDKIQLTEQLYHDARNGKLPNFAFVNPRAGVNFTTGQGSNDHHPDHDVALGEAFYKDLYEALRAGPQWNDTLFIVTYDEHGGFYDHHPTPASAPPPDNYTSYPNYFKFDRPGMRIPTLLLSPWVPKGMLISDPPATAKPASDSIFELTSIMATVRKILNINEGALTKRDAWAATFDYIFDILQQPRTDCPLHLPDAKAPSQSVHVESELPINGLQEHIATVHGHLSGRGYPSHITKQRDISGWLQESFEVHRQKVEQRKRRGKNDKRKRRHVAVDESVLKPVLKKDDYVLRCESFIAMKPSYVGASWEIKLGGPSLEKRTVEIKVNKSGNVERWCWTAPTNPVAGSQIGVAKCDNSTAQAWFWETDVTVRPATAPELCVTGHCLADLPVVSTDITLEPCTEVFAQHWAYQGSGGGNTGEKDSGMISFGDSIMAIVMAENT
jgi:phospholipase C